MAPLFRTLTRVGLNALQFLAADTACRVGGSLGVLAWRLGVRRRLVSRTMEQTLGLRGALRARLARRSYATMGANFLEIWTAGGVDGVERHAWPANPLWAKHVQATNPNLVLATLHMGSWDGALIGGRASWTRVLAYAKAQHNEAMDALLNERRAITGAEVLLTRQGDRTGAVTVMKALRSGAVVGLLADQRPRRDEGIAARFLGVATWCHPGPAFFADRAGVQVVPAFALRIRAGQTKIYVLRPFSVAGLSSAAGTQRVMTALSAVVAAFPGQYFWHHRRFTDTPESCPDADPQWRTGVAFFAQTR